MCLTIYCVLLTREHSVAFQLFVSSSISFIRVLEFSKYRFLPPCVVNNTFFIHSSVGGHLGGFYVLVIVNNAAVNLELWISFLGTDFVSFG